MSLRSCLPVITIAIHILYTSAELLTPYLYTPDIVRPNMPTTPSPTAHYTNIPAIQISEHFTDDFLCDAKHGITGWSNCASLNSQYHGPFNNIRNESNPLLFREFQCNEHSSVALLSFSIVFDCNVAFSDKVLLYINHKFVSEYNAASQESVLSDTVLDTTTDSDCKWYADRNISHSLPITHALQSFQIRFETVFPAVNVIKNIAIFDISIDCLTTNAMPNTVETLTNVIPRNERLKCAQYYTNSNSKSNLGWLRTMQSQFLAFSLQYTDSGKWTELRLSHFGSATKPDWYWSVQFELSKGQIWLQNKSNDEVLTNVFPNAFRLRDENDHCYLDIDSELNVFWNCQSGIRTSAAVWSLDTDTHRIYTAQSMRYLTFNEMNNDCKLTLLANSATQFEIVQTEPHKYNLYKLAVYDCRLSKDMSAQDTYLRSDGLRVLGYNARFVCDGNGLNIKFEIPALSQLSMNEWSDVWLTSANNNQIQIGMGTFIGRETDIIFSFVYGGGGENGQNSLGNLENGWIGTSAPYSTNWVFYDYSDSNVCDIGFVNAYNITHNRLESVYNYQLFDTEHKSVANGLWNSQYLMFEISHSAAWMKFETFANNEFVIDFGKRNAKSICDARGAFELNYFVILDNEVCSEYNGYDLTNNAWLFWIRWNEFGLFEVGNGATLGQSVIIRKERSVFEAMNIKNVNIGCSQNEICEWTFYAQKQRLLLESSLFSPQSAIIFKFVYDKRGIIHRNATVYIHSHTLDLNYSLHISYENEGRDLCVLCNDNSESECRLCQFDKIEINIGDYESIAMHKSFNYEYEISVHSNELFLAETKYSIRRTDFMDLNIEFDTNLRVDEQFKVTSFHINNKKITQNESVIYVKCHTLGIDAVLHINYAIDTCQICSVGHGYCVSCYDGIAFEVQNQSVAMHKLWLTSSDTLLTVNQYRISVTHCGVGLGLVRHSKCFECLENEINVLETDDSCHLCPVNDGFICEGSSDIAIKYNHWIAVYGYSDNALLFTKENDTFTIVSSVCPPTLCCQQTHGCYFVEKTQKPSLSLSLPSPTLCALNRDQSSVLCGECIPGYSEVFGSTSCQICDEDNYEYLLLIIVVGILYMIGISLVIQYNGESAFDLETDITAEMQHFEYDKLILHDYVAGLLISLFRPLSYFLQYFAFILVNYASSNVYVSLYFLMPLLQIFSIDLSVNNGGGFCFLANLDALSEELWLLFIPSALFVAIFVIYIFVKCGGQCLLQCCNVSYSPNFFGMIWSAVLLSFFTILTRLLKILSCKEIGNTNLHFYAAAYECYDQTWYFALTLLLFILLFLAFVFYVSFMTDAQQRQDSLIFKTFTNPYKCDRWYWEFVTLLQRMTVCAFVTFKYANESVCNVLLGLSLIAFIGFHLKLRPFKYKRINNMETLCLILVLLCFIVINLSFSETFIAIFVSIALLLPVLLFISRIYSAIKLYVSIAANKNAELNAYQQKILFNAIQRLPFYRKEIVLAIVHKHMPYLQIPTTEIEIVYKSTEDQTKLIDCEDTNITYAETDDADTDDDMDDAITTTLKTDNMDTITDFIHTTEPGSSTDTTHVISETTDICGIVTDMSNNNNSLFIRKRVSNQNRSPTKRGINIDSDMEIIEVNNNSENSGVTVGGEHSSGTYTNVCNYSMIAVGSRTTNYTYTFTENNNENGTDFNQIPIMTSHSAGMEEETTVNDRIEKTRLSNQSETEL